MQLFLETLTNASPVSVALLIVAVSICTFLLGPWLWSSLKTPGPWGLPIVGYYPFLRKDFHVHLHELSKKYGSAYVINLLGTNFLHLDNLEALREAHVNKIDDFGKRCNKHSVLQYPLKDGLIFLEGDEWKVHRKFFVQTMRELGLTSSKEEFKGPISDAIRSTVYELTELGGQPFEAIDLMNKKCSDIVMKFMLGDCINENLVSQLLEAYLKILVPMNAKNMLLVGNIAKYFLLPFVDGYKEMKESHKEMTRLLYQCLEEHKKTFDVNQQPRDFIDLYLQEKAIKEKKKDPTSRYYTDPILIDSLIQFIGDGSVAVGSFIAIILQAFGKHGDVQEAVYKEILQVIGSERLPNWEDRNNLPLTNSAIKEIMRLETLLMVFPDLECTRETTVCGIKIPKGTVTLINNWAIHNDPKIYVDPEKFDMTRFLPNKTKVEAPIQFGVGKRACAGENFVMTELFLFLVAILQKFLILPDKDIEDPSMGFELDPTLKLRAKLRTNI